jgi:hypothetical protein
MTYMIRPVLLDFLLADTTIVEGRAYAEVTDGRTLLRDATRLVMPVRDTRKSAWPAMVIDVGDLHVRREGHPGERISATARWANDDELAEAWKVARTAGGAFPEDPPEHAGVVVVELEH